MLPSEGWYPDPSDSSGRTLRWWNGEQWTEYVDVVMVPRARRPPPSLALVIALLAGGAVLLSLAIVIGVVGHAAIRSNCASTGGYPSIDTCEGDASMGVDFIAFLVFCGAAAAIGFGIRGVVRRRRNSGG